MLPEEPQLLTLNLGSDQRNSVLEVVKAIEDPSNIAVPYTMTELRPDDTTFTRFGKESWSFQWAQLIHYNPPRSRPPATETLDIQA